MGELQSEPTTQEAFVGYNTNRSGDSRLSTETIWFLVADRILRFIASRVRNKEDAEDIRQDVFLRIHNQLGGLKNSERLQSWIYQITRNAISDHYRKNGRAPELTSEYPENLAADDPVQDFTSEVASWLVPMIKTLPARYRDALLLSDVLGYTQAETAGRLGITLSGAKSRVQRGRVLLRSVLLACCHIEMDRLGRVVEWRSRRVGCETAGCGTRGFAGGLAGNGLRAGR